MTQVCTRIGGFNRGSTQSDRLVSLVDLHCRSMTSGFPSVPFQRCGTYTSLGDADHLGPTSASLPPDRTTICSLALARASHKSRHEGALLCLPRRMSSGRNECLLMAYADTVRRQCFSAVLSVHRLPVAGEGSSVPSFSATDQTVIYSCTTFADLRASAH